MVANLHDNFESPENRPDLRRVLEHVSFKQLPREMRTLIEAELTLYDEVLMRAESELAEQRQKAIEVAAFAAEILDVLH